LEGTIPVQGSKNLPEEIRSLFREGSSTEKKKPLCGLQGLPEKRDHFLRTCGLVVIASSKRTQKKAWRLTGFFRF